jgi:hypothetical protein
MIEIVATEYNAAALYSLACRMRLASASRWRTIEVAHGGVNVDMQGWLAH